MLHPAGRAPPTKSRQARPPFRLTVSAPTGAAHAPYLRRHLRRARPLIISPLLHLQVVLVNSRQMARLHQRFFGIQGPTDVITFPIDLDGRGRPLSGEVYICVPYAKSHARQRGLPVQKELLLYALHGMLHLCGYDDRTHRDFVKMHRKEDSILKLLRVGEVFARKASATGGGGG